MKNKTKTPKIIVILMIFSMAFIIIVTLFACVKFISMYNMSDSELCQSSGSVLINGNCHSECNTPVDEKRIMTLIVGIVLLFMSVLIAIFGVILTKREMKNGKKI